MKTLKFKTKEEASKVINDFIAQEYYGYEIRRTHQLAECETFPHFEHIGEKKEYWRKDKDCFVLVENFNITDDFERGMEVALKIEKFYKIDLWKDELSLEWCEKVDGVNVIRTMFLNFTHSWSFTLACAIYELITGNKIEVGE